MTYSEPQALIFHHTVAAGFYTVKQPEYVYTQSKQEQGVHLMFSSRGGMGGGVSGRLQPLQSTMVVNRDKYSDRIYFTFLFLFVQKYKLIITRGPVKSIQIKFKVYRRDA